ncbi:tol-pal system-associated acyl-CoA thioesterase [Paucibacter sp. R3-3]|uniref:Tol-pal system-associated acyl-CoA thioesterase n=1 Tax=Roseateles agri TaxID=3098619 RepID=A0ABU5DH25_9BURK|nr:tol-pal system-associated acyl-CoA thioesterase [Paucibacter sp. R3-3]MDY0745586.1 tol-pal system-associated acyl-CoA thioesterase [Paucibacter sp. R3-3]
MSAFIHPIRVYWEDTDAGGIVFYANYLKFFERARTEWLRGLIDLGQERMKQELGAMFVVSETSIRYLSPARLDDLLQVSVEVREAGRASMTLFQQASLDGTLLAEGTIRIGCVSPANLKPVRIPAPILDALKKKSP